jgi:hypothetical protein
MAAPPRLAALSRRSDGFLAQVARAGAGKGAACYQSHPAQSTPAAARFRRAAERGPKPAI